MGAHVVNRSLWVLALVLDAGPLAFQTMLAARVPKHGIPLVNRREETTAVDESEIDGVAVSCGLGVVMKIS